MLFSEPEYPEISTYPGAYIPDKIKLQTLREELSKSHEGSKKPDINISETNEYYKIEIAAPGLQSHDFFASITGKGHLSVSALHIESKKAGNEAYSKHSFNYECFHRDVVLPHNADTDFVKSEYRKGILSFWFLKVVNTGKRKPSVIAIY